MAKKHWLREWSVEVCAAIALLGGLFLLVETVGVRAAIGRFSSATVQFADAILHVVVTRGSDWLQPGNVAVVLVLVVGSVLLAQRVRYRLMQSPNLTRRQCPRCGHALRKHHRNAWGRWCSRIVPIRRYRCSRCNWDGWRVHSKASPAPPSV